jgi:hypothetical protein
MSRVGSVIVCLTRDRPQTLILTLKAVSVDLKKAKLRPRALIILDDSVKARCRLHNGRIFERFAKEANCFCLYHGPAEQHETLAVMAARGGVDASTFNFFFRKLGGLKWDLGGVRSYAMALANLIGKPFSPITMIDDDIVILPHARRVSAIDTLEQDVLDNPRLLTGGTLKGSPDESSIETAIRMICRFIGSRKHPFSSEMPMPISGGLLTFNSTCSHLYPFPRWYNEDWAWLAQYQARGYSVRVERRVVAKHLSSRKNLSLTTMKREQDGELLFEAVNWAIKNYSRTYVDRALRSLVYWEDVAREEVIYLNHIIELVGAMEIWLAEAQLELGQRGTAVRPILRLLKHTKNYVASIKPVAMMRRYSCYLEGVKWWRCFMKVAQRCEMDFDPIGGRV